MCLPFAFISTSRTLAAFNLDSSQASAASGHDAEVKDDLLLVGLMGLWLPAVPHWAVWLPAILSAPARFIWLLHASKEYFTLKIFLHLYIPSICNDKSIQSLILWWNAPRLSSTQPVCFLISELMRYFPQDVEEQLCVSLCRKTHTGAINKGNNECIPFRRVRSGPCYQSRRLLGRLMELSHR